METELTSCRERRRKRSSFALAREGESVVSVISVRVLLPSRKSTEENRLRREPGKRR